MKTTRVVACRNMVFAQHEDPEKVARWIADSTMALGSELTERLGEYWLIDSHTIRDIRVGGKLLMVNAILAHCDEPYPVGPVRMSVPGPGGR